MVRYVKTYTNKLKPDIYRKLYSLNLRGEGLMRAMLVEHKNDKLPVVYAIENGTILGWAILGEYWVTSKRLACFYVRKYNRRQGIGKKLAQKLKQLAPGDTIQVLSKLPLFTQLGFVK